MDPFSGQSTPKKTSQSQKIVSGWTDASILAIMVCSITLPLLSTSQYILTLLSPGHAGAMLQARQLGTELLVGVHSDEAILENKGPTVMRLDER